ncbi:MAG TPA: Spy/CpxP family protein refolding chaperone [Bacteroidota bacterium]|nr:Spy/CpxP family protein refolding chaperone [Bacteroidota bacterium]
MKTFVIFALAAMISTANAQRLENRDPRPRDGRNLRDSTGLDQATMAKIQKLREDHQKNVIALRAKMKTARVDFRSMRRQDKPDEAALLAKQKEISGIRGELEAAMLRHRLAVGNMLTPEQREHLKEHRRGDFAAGPGFSGNHRMEGAGRGMRGHRGGNFMNHRRGMRGGCSCNR